HSSLVIETSSTCRHESERVGLTQLIYQTTRSLDGGSFLKLNASNATAETALCERWWTNCERWKGPVEMRLRRNFKSSPPPRGRIEDVRLLDLGKIGGDSRFLSVLKIHDENRGRGGIKRFIGKQCSKTRSVSRPAALIFSATFSFSNIDGLDLFGALLQLDQGPFCKIFIIATQLNFDFHIGHIYDFLDELVGHTHIHLPFLRLCRFLPAEGFKPIAFGPEDGTGSTGIFFRIGSHTRDHGGVLEDFLHLLRGVGLLHRHPSSLQGLLCLFG